MKEISEYFARLLSWYTKGGFVDENGERHESGHHYKVAYWEVLNEIDGEHKWTPEAYTKFYDAVQPKSRVTQVFGSGGPRAFQFGARINF